MSKRAATIVVGLGWGDEGKGSIVDALVRRLGAGLVVRFSGGAQAAHTVEAGRIKHTFHQFGSGTLVPGVETFLSRHTLFNPMALFWEDEELKKIGVSDAMSRLLVDPDALVTTPYHVAANRIRELARGGNRHGSCGMGVGETVEDALRFGDQVIRAKDLISDAVLSRKLEWLACKKRQELEPLIGKLTELPQMGVKALEQLDSTAEYESAYDVLLEMGRRIRLSAWQDVMGTHPGAIVFEGAQGVLLDEAYGWVPPHVTWSRTTHANAREMLSEAGFTDPIQTFGVVRCYMTRHGAGPFPTEEPALAERLSDLNNPENDWQGKMRFGWLDGPLLRYSADCTKADRLAITCLDQLSSEISWKISVGAEPACYAQLPPDPDARARTIAEHIGLPVAIQSHGPSASDKVFI